jgi:DNA polymerase
VVTVDASQIEARLVAWLSGQDDLVGQFANKEDVYASFASTVFDFPVNKREHPTERFVGKQGVLGLGYGLGDDKFRNRLKTDSKNQTGTMIELSPEEAKNVVTTYRTLYYRIPAAWKKLQYEGIPVLAYGGRFTFGPCEFEKHAIKLPNGLKLHYYDLTKHEDTNEWWFTYGDNRKYIYGGKLMENICQALARIHTLDAALRIQKCAHSELSYLARLAQQAHDENVFVVPTELAQPVSVIALEEMRRRPWWAPGLPLDAEVGIGPTYGDAR